MLIWLPHPNLLYDIFRTFLIDRPKIKNNIHLFSIRQWIPHA